MDINTITQLISSVGFPILACCVMGWYISDTNKRHYEQMDKLTERHSEEVSQMKDSLDNNTRVLSSILEKLSK